MISPICGGPLRFHQENNGDSLTGFGHHKVVWEERWEGYLGFPHCVSMGL